MKVRSLLTKKVLYNPLSETNVQYCLRPVPGMRRTYTTADIAKAAERRCTLTGGDIHQTVETFIYELRNILRNGDKVRIPGLGILHITIGSTGELNPDDVSVKNINRVNIRFRVDNELRLQNNATALTKDALNNVKFELVRYDHDDKPYDAPDGWERLTGIPDDFQDGEYEGDVIDPDA